MTGPPLHRPRLPVRLRVLLSTLLWVAGLALCLGCRRPGGVRGEEPRPEEPAVSHPGVDSGGETPAARCSLDGEEEYLSGLALESEGQLEEARESLLCATRLHPGFEPGEEALRRVEERLYADRLGEARKLLARGDRRRACAVLRRAAVLRAVPEGTREAVRLLERNGYRPYGEDWLHREDVAARERLEARRAERRREELELGEEFGLDRRRDVRIFTDRESGEVLPFTRRLHWLLASLQRAHAELFYPLLPAAAGDDGQGIDVVVFARREDYEALTGSTNTVGMFLPARQASYFFFDDSSFDKNVRVLLHEVCHQLDARSLGLHYPPPWLQEGLAVYFEGAEVSSSGEIVSLGRLPASEASRAREAARSGGGRWWGLERIAGTAGVAELHGTDSVHDFYAQAASLVRFLLEAEGRSREIFHGLVDRARRPDARPERAWRDLEEVLRLHGETPASLEARWREAALEG